MVPANIAVLIGAQLVLVALPAVTLAWLLRHAGLPGGRTAAAILAGIVVSVLAGSSVLATARPEIHSPIILGGHAEHEQIVELVARQRTETVALRAAGVSEQAIIEAKARHAEQRVPLFEAMSTARHEHRERLNWLAIAFAAMHILLVMPTVIPRTRSAFRRDVSALVSNKFLGVRLGLMVALCATAVPFSVGLAMLYPVSSALGIGVLFGIGGLAATIVGLPFAAAAVALLVSLAVLVPVAYSPQVYVVGSALLVSMLLVTGLPPAVIRRWRSPFFRFASAAILPAMVALALVPFEYHAFTNQREFWIVLILAVIWSSDGRWFAAALAARITCPAGSPERENPWQLATSLLDAGAATAQIITAMVLTASGVIPGYVLPAAVAGAALIELTRGARAWIVRVIEFQKKLEDESADRRDP